MIQAITPPTPAEVKLNHVGVVALAAGFDTAAIGSLDARCGVA
jgi:hypothetical protein